MLTQTITLWRPRSTSLSSRVQTCDHFLKFTSNSSEFSIHCRNTETKSQSLMADAAEKPSINGRRLISQLKTLFSLPKTKRTYGFCYGFVFAFVAVTMFLAFTPFSNRGVSLLLPNFGSSILKKQGSENLVEKLTNCDLFDGEWVRDESYPLYEPGSCSLIDEQFNCFVNGRPDNDYYKLKWKPIRCSLPRLNGRHMLELLKGKRFVFVGDSLNTNMWESLVCILRNSVKNQSNVYEANGRHNFRAEASSSFVFKDYGCTIELFVSPFLVQEWEMLDKNGSKKETLRLDMISKLADEYRSADILIFNTGHWWTHEKTSKGENYYQEGSHVYTKLNVLEAFRRALTTWGRWVDANIDPMKTMVLFRGYSPSHFSGGQWNSGGQCHQDKSIKNETDLSLYLPKQEVLDRVFRGMKTPVSYLNITGMTDYRSDGHPSIYRKQTLSEEERKTLLMVQDCSHWCLPGVPDSWNELLYAELLRKQENTRRNVVFSGFEDLFEMFDLVRIFAVVSSTLFGYYLSPFHILLVTLCLFGRPLRKCSHLRTFITLFCYLSNLKNNIVRPKVLSQKKWRVLQSIDFVEITSRDDWVRWMVSY